MLWYSIEPKTKNVKGYWFLSFARKYKKQSLDTRLDAVKIASKKVVHKAGEFLGNKIADAVSKSNDDRIARPDQNPRNVEGIIIPLENREEIFNKLRKALKKWNTIKYLNY